MQPWEVEKIVQDWDKNKEKLQSLIGTSVEVETDKKELSWCFNKIPTDKAVVSLSLGKITKISVWSGLSWNAKSGRGQPTIVVE